MSTVEKELNFGDHGYARRTPLPGMEDDDADTTAEDRQPCTQCQLLKKQLEQEMQHTARLQKEVRWHPFSVYNMLFLLILAVNLLFDSEGAIPKKSISCIILLIIDSQQTERRNHISKVWMLVNLC